MSLSCSCYATGGWWYIPPEDYKPLATKRARRCCSCGSLIRVGDTCTEFERYCQPRNDIEERIYGDAVPLPSWFMCEECSDLFYSITELNYCVMLTKGESMRKLIKERNNGISE